MSAHGAWRGVLGLWMVAALSAGGCRDCGGEKMEPPAAPTLEEPPSAVRLSPLTLRGEKAAGANVKLQGDQDVEAQEVAALDDATAWTFDLPLREGQNQFVLFSESADGLASDLVGPYTVILDTQAPAVPTVDDYLRYVPWTPGTPPEVTLTGTKDPGANVLMATAGPDGGVAAVEVEARNNDRTWTQVVTVVEGINRFTFSSADELGNTSSGVEVVIESALPPGAPSLDNLVTPTNQRQFPMEGHKPPNTAVWFKWNGVAGSDREIAGVSELDTWTATVDLGDDGAKSFALYAKSVQGGSGASRSYALELDTVAPAAPQVIPAPPTSVTATAGQTSVRVELGGLKDGHADIADVADVEPFGTLVTRNPETLWSASVDLGVDHTFRLVSRDAAGNVSSPVEFTIRVVGTVPPPTVSPAPPFRTRDTEISLGGSRGTDLAVVVRWTVRAGVDAVPGDYQEVAASGNSPSWGGTLLLRDGEGNPADGYYEFYVLSQNAAGARSAEVGEAGVGSLAFQVEVDRTAPGPCAVDALASSLAGIVRGESEVLFPLSGTRDPDDDVTVRINGIELYSTGSTWSTNVTVRLVPAQNTFVITTEDDLGNVTSCGPPVVITGKEMLRDPTIDAVRTPTRLASQTIAGGKEAGHGVQLGRRDGATGRTVWGDVVYPVTVDTRWSHDLALTEGFNLFWVRSVDGDNWYSRGVGPVNIALDVTAPNPPTFTDMPAHASQAEIDVHGSKDGDSGVEWRPESIPDWARQVAVDGLSTFTLRLRLAQGHNRFCFRSYDEAGNVSAETCHTILRVLPPTVQFVAPPNHGVVRDATFDVEVSVVDTSEIVSARACFLDAAERESGCVVLVRTPSTNTWTGTVTIATPLNGSGYRLRATARNAGELDGHAITNVIYVSEPFLVSTHAHSTTSNAPRVAVDSVGHIHVVWEDDCWSNENCSVGRTTYSKDVFYRRFDGWTWSPVMSLTDGVDGDADSTQPAIAVDYRDDVHVVWQETGAIDGDSRSVLKVAHRVVSSVTGEPGAAKAVTKNSGYRDYAPRIAASLPAQAVELVWQRGTTTDQDIMRATYRNGVWGVGELVSVTPADGRSVRPDIAIDLSGNTFVVWQESPAGLTPPRFQVFLRVLNGPIDPLDPMQVCRPVTTYSDGTATQPSVAVGGPEGLAHIVWTYGGAAGGHLYSGTDTDIWHVTFDLANAQAPLGAASLVTPDLNDGISQFPSVAVDETTGDAHVVWGETGNFGGGGWDGDTYRAVWTGSQGMGGPQLVSAAAWDNGATAETHAVTAGPSLVMTWADYSNYGVGDQAGTPDVFLDVIPLGVEP